LREAGKAAVETLLLWVALGTIALSVRYTYFNLDDGWAASTRDTFGVLNANPTAFPSGMSAFSQYITAAGMKLGLYTDRGALILTLIYYY
jgi:alpha-galactosidase